MYYGAITYYLVILTLTKFIRIFPTSSIIKGWGITRYRHWSIHLSTYNKVVERRIKCFDKHQALFFFFFGSEYIFKKGTVKSLEWAPCLVYTSCRDKHKYLFSIYIKKKVLATLLLSIKFESQKVIRYHFLPAKPHHLHSQCV